MILDIQHHMDNYWSWLKQKTQLKEINDSVEITTPYLDRHNDCLQVYVVKQSNNEYRITDDGYILNDLTDSGCNLNSDKRQALLQLTLNGLGVKMKSDELFVLANSDNFAQQKHNLLQAMLAVNDLFYLAKSFVSNLFLEDVTEWLDQNEVRYSPNVKFTGKSGYDHIFHFLIPKSRQQPERLLQAINQPDKNHAQLAILAWEETQHVRPAGSRSIVILNDTELVPPASVTEAFQNYATQPIMWRARNDALDMLAA